MSDVIKKVKEAWDIVQEIQKGCYVNQAWPKLCGVMPIS